MTKEEIIQKIIGYNMSPAETYKMLQSVANIPSEMFDHIQSVSPTGIQHDAPTVIPDKYRCETEEWTKAAEKGAERKLQEDKEIAMAQDFTFHLPPNTGTGLLTTTSDGTDAVTLNIPPSTSGTSVSTNYPMYVHNDGGGATMYWEQTENPNLDGMVFPEPHRAKGTRNRRQKPKPVEVKPLNPRQRRIILED